MATEQTQKAYLCKTCGKLSAAEHLCNPIGLDPANCPYCGRPQAGRLHMCASKLAKLEFVCTTCGRVAVESGALCIPEKIVS